MKRIYRHPVGNFALAAAIAAVLLSTIISCLPRF